MEVLELDFSFLLSAIIISGGRTGHGTTEEHGTKKVQLLHQNGTLICNLTSLPEARFGHTQNGLVACGGGNYTHYRSTCFTFQNGFWIESYNLTEPRFKHSSWRSPDGVMLLGGKWIDGHFDPPGTSEVLTKDGAIKDFDLMYRT